MAPPAAGRRRAGRLPGQSPLKYSPRRHLLDHPRLPRGGARRGVAPPPRKPFDADGYEQFWASEIDLDAPLPPLRPYAISISLRPSDESESTLTQESYAYFLDNMIFK